MKTTSAIVLAAGRGTRMKSELPKVMHRLCGAPMVSYALRAALDAGCAEVVVVVGHGRRAVEEYLGREFSGRPVRVVVQEVPRGTGEAARIGLSAVSPASERLLVLNGDVPLIRAEDLLGLLAALDESSSPAALCLATCLVEDPGGYGRVLRSKDGLVLEVREQLDLRSDAERAVREINAGMYAARVDLARHALASLTSNNAQGELYLTDAVAFTARAGERIATLTLGADVLAGINDRDQLAGVERTLHDRLVRQWRIAGATIREGARIEASVQLEADATVETGAVLRGHTRIGRGATIDVGCVLTNVEVGEGAILKPYTVATDSRIGPRAIVGPFAHLRPESDVGEEAHLGNFVETKKTRLLAGAKANHLAYLGDSVIGEKANIGAGTIFCNYDGFQKHKTVVEAGAFIGSDSQVVAPVTIGANAYVATGTTVTEDVPANALAIGRSKQQNKEGYATTLRARLKAAKDAAK